MTMMTTIRHTHTHTHSCDIKGMQMTDKGGRISDVVSSGGIGGERREGEGREGRASRHIRDEEKEEEEDKLRMEISPHTTSTRRMNNLYGGIFPSLLGKYSIQC